MLKALLRAFVHGLIDYDEKLASPKKHTEFKTVDSTKKLI